MQNCKSGSEAIFLSDILKIFNIFITMFTQFIFLLLFLKTFFLLQTNVVLIIVFFLCSFKFLFILILCDMGTVHATYPIHFQWDEMIMKSIHIVLVVVAISVALLICYFILRLCIKSHNIDSENEQNNNELDNQIGNKELK